MYDICILEVDVTFVVSRAYSGLLVVYNSSFFSIASSSHALGLLNLMLMQTQ